MLDVVVHAYDPITVQENLMLKTRLDYRISIRPIQAAELLKIGIGM